jgi:predicted ATP-dependent serine protease
MQVDEAGNIDLLCENDMEVILEQIYEHSPKSVILDSIQTVSLSGVPGSHGSVSQVTLFSNIAARYLHSALPISAALCS